MTLLLLAACAGLFDGGKIDETCEDLPGGCDGGGDAGADTGPELELEVGTLDPVYGPVDGGTVVAISGGPFAADAVVTFGDSQATLRSWTETELLVETPAASQEGWTSVAVQTSQGSGVSDDAYRYFEDGTGYTGLVGFVQFRHPIGTLASQGDKAFAVVQFLEPTTQDGWWDRFAGAMGQCYPDYDPNLGWESIDPGASTLELVGTDGTAVALAWDSAEQAYNGTSGTGEVPADHVTPGSTWSLPSFQGTELPEFSLDSFVALPDEFELTAPALDTTSTPVLTQEDLVFEWSSKGEADGVIIDLTLADGATGSQLERVTCLVEDNGAYTPPTGAFSEWDEGLVLYVKVGLAIETRGILPLNNSDVRINGAYTISGAATTDN